MSKEETKALLKKEKEDEYFEVENRPAHPDNEYSNSLVIGFALLSLSKFRYFLFNILLTLATFPHLVARNIFFDRLAKWIPLSGEFVDAEKPVRILVSIIWMICVAFSGHAIAHSLDVFMDLLEIGDYVSFPLCLLSFLGGVHWYLETSKSKRHSIHEVSSIALAIGLIFLALISILHDVAWLITDTGPGTLRTIKSWLEFFCEDTQIGPLTIGLPEFVDSMAMATLLLYVLQLLFPVKKSPAKWEAFILYCVTTLFCFPLCERLYAFLDEAVDPYFRSPVQCLITISGAILAFEKFNAKPQKHRDERAEAKYRAKQVRTFVVSFILPACVQIWILRSGRPLGPLFPLSAVSTLKLFARAYSTSCSIGYVTTFIDKSHDFNVLLVLTALYWTNRTGQLINYFLGLTIESSGLTILVNCAIGIFASIAALFLVSLWHLLPFRDARFMQGVTDHSMDEYEHLIKDHFLKDTDDGTKHYPRKITSYDWIKHYIPKVITAGTFIAIVVYSIHA